MMRKRKIQWRRFSLFLLFILVIFIGYNRVEALISAGVDQATAESPVAESGQPEDNWRSEPENKPGNDSETSEPVSEPRPEPEPEPEPSSSAEPIPSSTPQVNPSAQPTPPSSSSPVPTPSPSAGPPAAETNPSAAPQDNGAKEPSERKRVALTFDDGPDLKWTPQILDILKERNIKATFFLVGLQADKHPEVIQRIADEGHAVGNHSWGHKKLPELNSEQISEEIEKLDEVLVSAIGESSTLFRAPYGALSDKVQNIMNDKGYQHVGWTVDPRDWAGTTPDEMMKIVERQLEPDGIVLLHSFGGKAGDLSNTVEFLPDLIDYLQEKGYDLVTVPELS